MTNAVANRILIPVLKGPAGLLLGRRLAVVEYDGRRSGTQHRLVAGYRGDPERVRIRVGSAEHKTWWRNFEDPRPVRLRLAGHDRVGEAHLADEGGEVTVVVDLGARGPTRP